MRYPPIIANNDGINLNYFRNSFNINPRINTSSGKASYNTAKRQLNKNIAQICISVLTLTFCIKPVLIPITNTINVIKNGSVNAMIKSHLLLYPFNLISFKMSGFFE